MRTAIAYAMRGPRLVLVADKVNGPDVKCDMGGTGIGPRTEARIEPSDMMLPTRCKMERPARP